LLRVPSTLKRPWTSLSFSAIENFGFLVFGDLVLVKDGDLVLVKVGDFYVFS